jgi:HK97 gp10 family phage protein
VAPQIETKVNITGGEELFQALTARSERFAKKGLREALRAGAKVVWFEMALTVRKGWHVWPGKNRKRDYAFLAEHIGIKIKLSSKQEQGTAQIGPVKKGFWGMLLEFGTSKTAAKPWMRPAFESSKEAALQAFVNKLREIIGAEMKK